MSAEPSPDDLWWKTGVVYEIYPRSFADSNGDGVGDLEGVRRRLDYLTWLGVDAVWLSPFYPSPMADFGYDVADYCDVDPLFGSLSDFDRLLTEAHQRGLKVIVDWVPNHTSDHHPWFVQSRSSRDNPKRDWYIWRDGAPDRPPNNWIAALTRGSAWTWDERTRAWYLHLYLSQQPDLNWANPDVVSAMHGVLRFWLDRGVDGFRIDVIHAIGKDPALPDAPPQQSGLPYSLLNDDERAHPLIREFRTLLDAYAGERMMVGEVYILDTTKVAAYYGAGDELHLAFNFPPLWAPWTADAWRYQLDTTYGVLGAVDAWPTWALSNHDHRRHRTRYGSEARARAAAVFLLTQRGTPFLFAGEELGLQDAIVPPDRVVDPGGRDGCRAPIPWDAAPTHGWPAEPWLPWPPEPERNNVAALQRDPTSILHLYRRLLEARRRSPALQRGDWRWLASPDGTLAYVREADGDRRAVIVNFTDEPVHAPLEDDWRVQIASDGTGEGQPFAGTVPPSAGLLLRP
jgi:alpha-glucosidase